MGFTEQEVKVLDKLMKTMKDPNENIASKLLAKDIHIWLLKTITERNIKDKENNIKRLYI